MLRRFFDDLAEILEAFGNVVFMLGAGILFGSILFGWTQNEWGTAWLVNAGVVAVCGGYWLTIAGLRKAANRIKEREDDVLDQLRAGREIQEARRKADAEQEELRARLRAEQQRRWKKIEELEKEFRGALAQYPLLVKYANEDVQAAIDLFSRRAALPFWNAVEKAQNSIRNVVIQENLISKSLSEHCQLIVLHHEKIPKLAESPLRLPSVAASVGKLNEVTRSALEDNEFASIMLKRETLVEIKQGHSLLKDGFRELASTVETSRNALRAEIENLGGRLQETLETEIEASQERWKLELEKKVELIESVRGVEDEVEELKSSTERIGQDTLEQLEKLRKKR